MRTAPCRAGRTCSRGSSRADPVKRPGILADASDPRTGLACSTRRESRSGAARHARAVSRARRGAARAALARICAPRRHAMRYATTCCGIMNDDVLVCIRARFSNRNFFIILERVGRFVFGYIYSLHWCIIQ